MSLPVRSTRSGPAGRGALGHVAAHLLVLAAVRVVLGDEMGLGKTMQALAVMSHLTAQGENRFLVVCPASVLATWHREIAAHTTLAAHRFHGDGERRQEPSDPPLPRRRRMGGDHVAPTLFLTGTPLAVDEPSDEQAG